MFEFLKKIFRRNRGKSGEKGEPARLDLRVVFQDVFRQNLAVMTGKPADVAVRRLPERSLEGLPALDEPGFFYNTFCSSDTTSFAMYIPGAAFETLRSLFAHVHGEQVEKIPTARIGMWLDGNLSRLFYLSEHEESSQEEPPWRVKPFLSLPKTYHPDEKEETLWRFSGSTLFRVTSGAIEFYLLVDSAELARVEKLLISDRFFQRAVRSEVMLRYTGGDRDFFDRESTIRINIEKNSEFLLGRFFIPLNPRFKTVRGRTCYRAVVASSGGGIDTGTDVTRFRLGFNFRNQVFEWYYSFYMDGLEQDRPVLKGIVSEAMNFLNKIMNIHGVRGNFLNPNIYPDLSDYLCLEADIFFGKRVASCRVFVGSDFLSTLGELLLPPWEIDFLKRNLFVRILSVLSLNQTLLRKNIHTFYREGAPTAVPEDSGMPRVIRVAELLNLVPSDDYRLIVQNFFMARGWPVRKLLCLFFFEHRKSEDEPIRIYVDRAFDSARFLAALPRSKRDEWNRSFAASLNWAELQERNLRAMLELYEAAREDRLVLSYRTRFLLRNEFKQRIDDDYTSAIAKLVDDRIYIDQISELPPPVAQRVLGQFPLDRLALALIVDSSDRAILNRFISRQKRDFLEEEIGFRKEKYQKGEIRHREVFDAMAGLRKVVGKEYGIWLRSQEEG